MAKKKKCDRCNAIFDLEVGTRCIYCDALLRVGEEEEFIQEMEEVQIRPVTRQALVGRKMTLHDRMQLVLGNYFRVRNFSFKYHCAKYEYRMGEGFKRRLIFPLSVASFIMIPWVIYDIWDSFMFRSQYKNYDEDSTFKMTPAMRRSSGYDPREVEYCKEYAAIIEDIITGKIGEKEEDYVRLAEEKVKAGQRSAWRDMHSFKSFKYGLMDMVFIVFSLLCWVLVMTAIFYPPFFQAVTGVDPKQYIKGG